MAAHESQGLHLILKRWVGCLKRVSPMCKALILFFWSCWDSAILRDPERTTSCSAQSRFKKPQGQVFCHGWFRVTSLGAEGRPIQPWKQLQELFSLAGNLWDVSDSDFPPWTCLTYNFQIWKSHTLPNMLTWTAFFSEWSPSFSLGTVGKTREFLSLFPILSWLPG